MVWQNTQHQRAKLVFCFIGGDIVSLQHQGQVPNRQDLFSRSKIFADLQKIQRCWWWPSVLINVHVRHLTHYIKGKSVL